MYYTDGTFQSKFPLLRTRRYYYAPGNILTSVHNDNYAINNTHAHDITKHDLHLRSKLGHE